MIIRHPGWLELAVWHVNVTKPKPDKCLARGWAWISAEMHVAYKPEGHMNVSHFLSLEAIGPNMTEDDIYRASTQYRLWSFTPESLASLRSTTNSLAADGVRTAIHRLNLIRAEADAQSASGHGQDPPLQSNFSREVDCLTVEEEQKLVGFYCIQTIKFADFCDFPTNVKVPTYKPPTPTGMET